MRPGKQRAPAPRDRRLALARGCTALVAAWVLASCSTVEPASTAEFAPPVPPTKSRYVIFFESGSAELDAVAVETVEEIVAGAESADPDRILIRGYTDRRGSAGDNALLSDRRAQAVARALIREGIEAERLRTEAFGETSIGESARESRRVEVLFRRGR